MVIEIAKKLITWLLVIILASPAGVLAQGTGQVAEVKRGYAYTQEDLDEMLAPIALYPDELLSQILI